MMFLLCHFITAQCKVQINVYPARKSNEQRLLVLSAFKCCPLDM